MPTVGFHPPTRDMDINQLSELIAKTFKELEWLLSGNVDFKNIKALGITTKNLKAESVIAEKIKAGTITATQIEANSITADRMDVSELSAISANLGHIIAGLIESISIYGSYIATANGTYPRSEMSVAGNLFAAYQSATQFIKITPDASAGNPGLTYRNGVALGFLYQLTTDLLLGTSAGSAGVQVSSGKDLFLNANVTGGYKTKMDSFSTVVDDAGVSLQSKFDAKANKSVINGTVYVASVSGGPATTPITFANGIRTS